jgi:hypothetical protein
VLTRRGAIPNVEAVTHRHAWLVLAALIASASLLAACKTKRRRSARAAAALARPASKEALIRRALRAVRDNNPSAYVELMSTVSEVTRACPERFEDRGPGKLRAKWQRMLERTRREINRCNKLVDWKRARQLSIKGGRARGQLGKCEQKVVRLRDIRVIFAVGSKRVEVRLSRPYVRGETLWGFGNGPRCRLLEHSEQG